jgi:hypothetical protein
MQKRISFWITIAITLSVWLSIIWIVQAWPGPGAAPPAHEASQPPQQCNRGLDLAIKEITIDSRGVGQPYESPLILGVSASPTMSGSRSSMIAP